MRRVQQLRNTVVRYIPVSPAIISLFSTHYCLTTLAGAPVLCRSILFWFGKRQIFVAEGRESPCVRVSLH